MQAKHKVWLDCNVGWTNMNQMLAAYKSGKPTQASFRSLHSKNFTFHQNQPVIAFQGQLPNQQGVFGLEL